MPERVRGSGRARVAADARARNGNDPESGQALLELALVVPILVMLVMAIFQFAYVLESQMGLTNAVREAARRVAATEPTSDPAWAGAETDWVVDQLCGISPGCNDGLLRDNVQGFDDSGLWVGSPDVLFCSYTVDGQPQVRVQVDVTYKHPIFFGPLTFATDFVDGTVNGFWDLVASAQMRMENLDEIPGGYTDPGACPP
jgi:hypothetical protein